MTSKGFTPNLPGLATHYAREGAAFTWCGRPTRVVLVTSDRDQVNCKKCRRSMTIRREGEP